MIMLLLRFKCPDNPMPEVSSNVVYTHCPKFSYSLPYEDAA